MPKKRSKTKAAVASRVKLAGGKSARVTLAAAFALAFVGLGGYLIYNASFAAQTVLRSGMAGNQCIDSNAGVWDCNGSGGETWAGLQVAGQIKVGGVCLKEAGASASTGTAQDQRALGADIVTYSCGSTSAPYGGAWHWDSSHRLHNNHAESKGGSFCLDVTGSQTHGNLELWSCNGGGNQQWFVGTYTGSNPTPPPGSTSYSCYVSGYGSPSNTLCAYLAHSVENHGYSGSAIQAEMTCASNIFWRESGWRSDVWNGGSTAPTGSGAYGIAQSLPYSKYPQPGWPVGYGGTHDPNTQINWGVGYMKSSYNSPCGAWSFWQGHHYYVQR
jgi:hypothetical protein